MATIFHIGALNWFLLRSLVRGSTVVLRRVLEPKAMLEDLVNERVNSMFGVPSMFAALSRLPGLFDADLSQLRSVVVAAAPVPPSPVTQFTEHGIFLQHAWGLAETAPFAIHLPVELTMSKVGSAGVAMPYTAVWIVDVVRNKPVDTGSRGSMVRGPDVIPWYCEDPAATSAAFDDQGWFHSGDIEYLHREGSLFIVNRLKDMMLSRGENVYSAEVETVLADMPGLSDVAVVGMPDETWGETVMAMISLTEGSDVTLEDVRAYAERRLARYKLPTRLNVLEMVPHNASGKLDKVSLRSMLEDT